MSAPDYDPTSGPEPAVTDAPEPSTAKCARCGYAADRACYMPSRLCPRTTTNEGNHLAE